MYFSTFKLFVSSSTAEEFKEKYLNRFNSESTIHIPLLINGYDAFIFLNQDIVNQISKIYSLDKKVFQTFDRLPGVAKEQYIKKSFVDEITHTNEIEGVISTRKEIRDILDDIASKDRDKSRFKSIVNKYRKLLNNEIIPLKTSVDIRKIYDDMLLEEIKQEDINNIPDGKIFRKDLVHVFKGNDEEIHTGVYPEDKVIEYMNKSLDFLNDENIDILIRLAAFHYLFGYIHPFYDGNGRISRFISSYILSKELTEITGFRLSMTIKDNIKTYYDAFKYTNDKRNRGDITTFVSSFFEIIIKSLEQTIKYVNEKYDELKHYESLINKLSFINKQTRSLLYYLLQTELFSKFGLSVSELVKISKHSKNTCLNCINELTNKDYIYFNKSGNTNYYRVKLTALDQE